MLAILIQFLTPRRRKGTGKFKEIIKASQRGSEVNFGKKGAAGGGMKKGNKKHK